MKISVIVPVFNSEKRLSKCIQSIINQTYKNLEILLINDGSTDNSLDICNEFSKKDNRIKVINKQNGGVSSTRNVGLNNATGDFIFFIDSDDYIDKDVLRILLKNHKEKVLTGIVHSNINGNYTKINNYKKQYSKDEFIKSIFQSKVLGVVWGYLFEKNLIKNLNFDENTSYLEDTLFLIQYLEQINTIEFINLNQYYNYVLNNEGITASNKNTLTKIKDILYSLEKINIKTNKEYEKYIITKKVILLEKEMRNINDYNDLTSALILVKSLKYNGNSPRYKYFIKIVNKKNYSQIIFYYRIRKKLKEIKNRRKK